MMPAQPEALAHVAADPPGEVGHFPALFGQLEVAPPPPDVVSPLRTQLLARQALPRFPQGKRTGSGLGVWG